MGAAGMLQPTDDFALLQARADVLFTYDERGRMVYENDPERRPAPRVYLAFTGAGYVLRFGQDLPDAMCGAVEAMVEDAATAEDLRIAPPVVEAIGELLGAQAHEGGPAYRFPDVLSSAGGAVQLTEENVGMARDTLPWLLQELREWWPCFVVVRDGAAVSICFSSRVGVAVCEAGLVTIPAYRGRGFAGAVTAAWAVAVREAGAIPVYSTSWSNFASQRVAQRLGLTMVGADVSWR
jgi:hypothetical protein